MKDLIIIGDSYAAGRIPHTKTDGALVEALKKRQACISIDDYAVSGSTAKDWNTGKLHEKMDEAIDRAKAGIDVAAIVSVGGNDMFDAIADSIVTSKELKDFFNDTLAVVSRVAREVPTFMFVYPLPAFMSKSKPAQWAHTILRWTLLGIAWQAGATPIDLGEILTHEDDFDGADIHPSLAGYGRIADKILDALKNQGK